MRAIAFFARSRGEAEALWEGRGFGELCTFADFWERVTNSGRRNSAEFLWGDAGPNWMLTRLARAGGAR